LAERSLKADIFGVFSSNIFGLMVGLLVGIILPRELGPTGTGLFYAILAIPQLTFSLVELGTKASIVFFSGKKAVSEDRMISALLFIFTISTLLCLIIFGIIFSVLKDPDYQLSFIILVILITPFRLITTYARAFILAKEKIKQFNRLNIYFLIVNLLGVIGFVWIAHLGVLGAFLSLLLASVVVAVYALVPVSYTHLTLPTN
jgi:O-antigen/teichoic acid export membrane protein